MNVIRDFLDILERFASKHAFQIVLDFPMYSQHQGFVGSVCHKHYLRVSSDVANWRGDGPLKLMFTHYALGKITVDVMDLLTEPDEGSPYFRFLKEGLSEEIRKHIERVQDVLDSVGNDQFLAVGDNKNTVGFWNVFYKDENLFHSYRSINRSYKPEHVGLVSMLKVLNLSEGYPEEKDIPFSVIFDVLELRIPDVFTPSVSSGEPVFPVLREVMELSDNGENFGHLNLTSLIDDIRDYLDLSVYDHRSVESNYPVYQNARIDITKVFDMPNLNIPLLCSIQKYGLPHQRLDCLLEDFYVVHSTGGKVFTNSFRNLFLPTALNYFDQDEREVSRGVELLLTVRAFTHIYADHVCPDCGSYHAVYKDNSFATYLAETPYLRWDEVFDDECPFCEYNKPVSVGDFGEYQGRTYFPSNVLDREVCSRWEGGIRNWDYEPSLEFYRDFSDTQQPPLYLGVELEIDDGGESSKNADVIIKQLSRGMPDRVYAMHDGSIDNGFEIATHPATLSKHMDDTHLDYKSGFGVAVHLGYRGHNTDTCGIHVHMNKSFFGETALERDYRAALMALILENNWDAFVRFSRRDYTRISEWADKKNYKKSLGTYVVTSTSEIKVEPSQKSPEALGRTYKYHYDGDKYVALNCSHRNTYELRIFKSTLKYGTYMAILQLVSNLANMVMTLDYDTADAITFEDVVRYQEYEELTKYLGTRGYTFREEEPTYEG